MTEISQSSPDKQPAKVPAAWKTACLIFGLGFIFTAGMLVGEKIKENVRPLVNGMAETPDLNRAKSQALAVLPSTIADVAAEAAPFVVTIELQPLLPGEKKQISPNSFANPLGISPGSNPGANPPNNESPELGISPPPRKSLGTGVIMRSDGFILTSAHVIRPGTSIMVGLNDKRRLPAEVVGSDLFSDLAVLRVNASDLPAGRFGTIKNLRPGDWAIAIGSPFGFDHTVTLGIISAIGRSLDDEAFHNRVDLIQTDAADQFW